MKITVIGTGYVGLITGSCFSYMGNDVYCVDIDEKKINNLKNGKNPIFEEKLDSIINQSYPYWELIIIDDGSTDLTPEIINMYKANNNRIILYNCNSF